MAPISSRNVDIVRRTHADFDRRDLAGVPRLLDPAITCAGASWDGEAALRPGLA